MNREVDSRDRVFAAGAEDRATLESDLSAVVGEYTEGAGLRPCPLLPNIPPVLDKAINSLPRLTNPD